MGEHATESNSLSGKSLPHVNELSLSLAAIKFCPISPQLSVNSFILFELLQTIFGLVFFSFSAVSFPLKKMAAFFFYLVHMGWMSFIL